MEYTMRFFLFSSLLVVLFLTACSSNSLTAKVVDFPTDNQDSTSVTQSTDSRAVFCQAQKFGVLGKDDLGNTFEYNNSCLGKVWYHSYTCSNNEVISTNVKCQKGCNLFGCED